MKKTYLSLLLILFYFGAPAREYAIPGDEPVLQNISASALQLPHAELEVSFRTVATAPVQRVIKKIPPGTTHSLSFQGSCMAFYTSIDPIGGSVHSKSYLLHIYPSLHFW